MVLPSLYSLRRVATKGRGAGENVPHPVPRSSPLRPSFALTQSPLPKSNMAPRQTFHCNLRGPPAYRLISLLPYGSNS